MTTYRFTGPSTARKHKGTCPRCRKNVTRARTFKHTVNPFNCVGEGDNRRPKTWTEVAADVQAEAEAWLPDFQCQNCEFDAWVMTLTVNDLTHEIWVEGCEQKRHRKDGNKRGVSLCTKRITVYETRVQELTNPAVTP